MKILIDANYGLDRLSIVANERQNIFTANGRSTTLDMDYFIFKVCDITMHWPNSLQGEANVKDGTQVVILIEDGKTKKKMKYVNELPEDYYKLEILLDEVSNNVETNLQQIN